MNNAVVIGYGTVGKATAKAFGIKKYYSRSERNMEIVSIAKLEFIFICLPTPTKEGKCDTSAIIEFIEQVQKSIQDNEIENQPLYIIRSTVYPGFNRFLQERFGIKVFVSNPEFLSEDTAEEDAKHPDLVVIGSDNIIALERVEAIYRGVFQYPAPEYVITDSATAELIKYTLNTFFATKVIFANIIFDYAQETRANYETIKGVLEFHKWGSKNHFKPWYKGKRGLHGKCLPKDLEAFHKLTHAPLFESMIFMNQFLKELRGDK